MKFHRGGDKMGKMISVWLSAVVLLLGSASGLFGQGYPDRAINLIIPMAPGDGVDVSGRLMAEELSKLLKVPIVTLNKPGAGGGVGTDSVAKAKNDGYTLLLTPNAPIIYNKMLHPEDVPYDSFKDLTPLGLTTLTPIIMAIRGDAPYKDFKEMMDYANKNPGKVRCGTMGVGSVGDFDTEIVKTLGGMNVTAVPFKGASPAITALLGGHVEAAAVALGPMINHMRSGKAKGIVISNRFYEFPDIPTFKQLGYQHDLLGVWFAFYAPAGVPAQIKETLALAIEKVVKDPTLSSKLAQLGMIQEFEPPEKLLTRMHEEYRMVEEIAKRTGMVK
jgi:tripartite-type tricarboxylate transporter receptor subunit TctC